MTGDELNGELPLLVVAAQGGDRGALAQLVDQNQGWVRGVVYSFVRDAERTDDIVQTVWLRASERIAALRDPSRWKSWLYQIARNATLDEIQSRRRRREIHDRFKSQTALADGQTTVAADAGREETHQRVLSAIQGLPEIYREPLVLKHLQNWSYKQIGEALNLPAATVETRLVRARRLLRDSLKDLADE